MKKILQFKYMFNRIKVFIINNLINNSKFIFNIYSHYLLRKSFKKTYIQIIQNALRKGVYDKSNQKILIDEQPKDQIVSVMRSMFYQHSKNLDNNIPQQIQELNNYVINYTVNAVFNEAVAYLKYKEDSSKMHVPMSAPLYSNKTNKTLELKPWF